MRHNHTEIYAIKYRDARGLSSTHSYVSLIGEGDWYSPIRKAIMDSDKITFKKTIRNIE